MLKSIDVILLSNIYIYIDVKYTYTSIQIDVKIYGTFDCK